MTFDYFQSSPINLSPLNANFGHISSHNVVDDSLQVQIDVSQFKQDELKVSILFLFSGNLIIFSSLLFFE